MGGAKEWRQSTEKGESRKRQLPNLLKAKRKKRVDKGEGFGYSFVS